MRTKIAALSAVVVLSLSLSACLKTRAQLREEEADNEQPSRPVPAKVQDVQPQGQYVIDELKGEITRLSGRIEDIEQAQKQKSKNKELDNVEDQVKTLTNRIADLEKSQEAMIEQLKNLQSTQVPAKEPVEQFELGKAKMKKNDFEGAIESFSNYLKYPKGKHVEEATFLRAESHFATKQYKKAIVDYSKFPEKFTKSKKVPLALYKIGLAFEALGLKDDAKGFYQEVVDKYPTSPEGKKAKKKVK